MKNILLIMAAGKSSRFGGFPKAIANIGGFTNVENTVLLASRFYDEIFLCVNDVVFDKQLIKPKGFEIFSIKMGQGDAHSLLKAMNYLKHKETCIKSLTVCWGDAFFKSEEPFRILMNQNNDYKICVACSYDKKPYAWFDLKDGIIYQSHFMKKDGVIDLGLHDQSLFRFNNFDYCIRQLEKYKTYLGILDDDSESYTEEKEMKLLNFFEFLYNIGERSVYPINVESGNVYSFNTQTELDEIRTLIKGESKC